MGRRRTLNGAIWDFDGDGTLPTSRSSTTSRRGTNPDRVDGYCDVGDRADSDQRRGCRRPVRLEGDHLRDRRLPDSLQVRLRRRRRAVRRLGGLRSGLRAADTALGRGMARCRSSWLQLRRDASGVRRCARRRRRPLGGCGGRARRLDCLYRSWVFRGDGTSLAPMLPDIQAMPPGSVPIVFAAGCASRAAHARSRRTVRASSWIVDGVTHQYVDIGPEVDDYGAGDASQDAPARIWNLTVDGAVHARSRRPNRTSFRAPVPSTVARQWLLPAHDTGAVGVLRRADRGTEQLGSRARRSAPPPQA